MPTLDNMEIPKPKNWQDFERLVESYARINWPGCMVTLFGGVGQEQRGVDIYIKDTKGNYIGIQCTLIYNAIKREIGFKWDETPIERFEDLCTYIQKRINDTILGKTRKRSGMKNYSTYEEYVAKKSRDSIK